MNPSPSHVAVPAVKRCPGDISNAFPMSPTILSSASDHFTKRGSGGSEIKRKHTQGPNHSIPTLEPTLSLSLMISLYIPTRP
jgi:hypothetical protein